MKIWSYYVPTSPPTKDKEEKQSGKVHKTLRRKEIILGKADINELQLTAKMVTEAKLNAGRSLEQVACGVGRVVVGSLRAKLHLDVLGRGRKTKGLGDVVGDPTGCVRPCKQKWPRTCLEMSPLLAHSAPPLQPCLLKIFSSKVLLIFLSFVGRRVGLSPPSVHIIKHKSKRPPFLPSSPFSSPCHLPSLPSSLSSSSISPPSPSSSVLFSFSSSPPYSFLYFLSDHLRM